MWTERLAAAARQYRDGTLSIVEASGYPSSVRCTVELDDVHQVIRFPALPPSASHWRGPACLLFHRHDARLENQYQLLIRGRLVEDHEIVTFLPSAFVTANGSRDMDRMPHAGAPLQLLRFMLLGRRQARAYLRRRKKPWPAVDFKPMLAVLRELKRSNAT